VNSSDLTKRALEPGEKIGVFRVYTVSDAEVILGEDDRHLDFRISVHLKEVQGMKDVTISTVVHYNNTLGKYISSSSGLFTASLFQRCSGQC
jgi:hypothetical protein